jgi:hypothetical protein
MKPFAAGLLALLLAAGPALAADGAAPKAEAPQSFEVPYRLSDTLHVVVRAKINNKGPFNFILDTGAPAVFITEAVAKKVGAKTDAKGWANFDRFELEGGLVVDKAEGQVEDLFQLKGMNGMGLAGVEIHGVVGFNVLARYKVKYDFTEDKLVFTPLKFDPPPVIRMGKAGGGAGGLEAIGSLMQMLGPLFGGKANFEVLPRGFLGAEVAEADGKVTIKQVLKDGPAAAGGLKPGDKVVSVGGLNVESVGDLFKRFAKNKAGDSVVVQVERNGKMENVTVELGKGL